MVKILVFWFFKIYIKFSFLDYLQIASLRNLRSILGLAFAFFALTRKNITYFSLLYILTYLLTVQIQDLNLKKNKKP